MCYCYHPYGIGNNLDKVGEMRAIDLSGLSKKSVKLDESFGVYNAIGYAMTVQKAYIVYYDVSFDSAPIAYKRGISALNLSTGESYLLTDEIEGMSTLEQRKFRLDGDDILFHMINEMNERRIHRIEANTSKLTKAAYDSLTKNRPVCSLEHNNLCSCSQSGSMISDVW